MYNYDEERLQRGCYSTRCKGSDADINRVCETENFQGNGCGTNTNSTWGLRGYPLASVFSPLQDFTDIYDCENALIRGTIFTQLDLPFVCGGMNGGVSRG